MSTGLVYKEKGRSGNLSLRYKERVYNSVCAMWLDSQDARNKGVSIAKIGFIKLRFQVKRSFKKFCPWETGTTCVAGRDSGDRVNHFQNQAPSA